MIGQRKAPEEMLLHTERLIVRPFRPDDLEHLFALLSDRPLIYAVEDREREPGWRYISARSGTRICRDALRSIPAIAMKEI